MLKAILNFKHNGKSFAIGDEYEGKESEHLLKQCLIEDVEKKEKAQISVNKKAEAEAKKVADKKAKDKADNFKRDADKKAEEANFAAKKVKK